MMEMIGGIDMNFGNEWKSEGLTDCESGDIMTIISWHEWNVKNLVSNKLTKQEVDCI